MYLPSDITSMCIPIKKNMIQWHSKYNEWYKCITHGITYSFSMENGKKMSANIKFEYSKPTARRKSYTIYYVVKKKYVNECYQWKFLRLKNQSQLFHSFNIFCQLLILYSFRASQNYAQLNCVMFCACVYYPRKILNSV